ncbi:hypothetical protein JWS13_06120 [Rhodococcus pseudokoreensis]|uniref:Uncharacterized protein n=1 Tax=Rhodococcus pseudokoreensis TaxID=2811421 RepID=A0A974ZS47_9NOCA|nr:hypothetical protein [Rhodococcus pseudokoreensis]QSE88224.1 hypothetical protein JWS13_06120 [Rhodococcus pseudokoreensis]
MELIECVGGCAFDEQGYEVSDSVVAEAVMGGRDRILDPIVGEVVVSLDQVFAHYFAALPFGHVHDRDCGPAVAVGNRSLGATGVDCGRTEQKARMASTEHVDRDLVDEEVAARTARIGATR